MLATLRLLTPGESALAVGLLQYLNPQTPAETLSDRLASIFAQHPHYQIVGAFLDTRLVGLTGVWIATRIWCGRYLEIDNFIVHPDHRGGGIGAQLIRHLETMAREQECRIIVLDTYANLYPAHRFYHRQGFELRAFHFVKDVT